MGTTRVAIGRTLATLTLALALPGFSRTQSCHPEQAIGPAPEVSQPIVSVYWDISGSMSFSASVTREVVSTLDSSILQLARVNEIKNYTIGNKVLEITSASKAHVDTKQDTALHKAAEQIGRQLADRKVGAAIIVSDLDLEIADADRGQHEACPGVPMPSNKHAGAIFGRCLMAGLRAGGAPALPDLVIDAFSLQAQPPAAA